jgi:predicted DNA-binding transcriptional regulator AlpA
MKMVLRKAEAMEFVGLRKTQFEEKVLMGEFPAPIDISDSGRAVAWLRTDLEKWLSDRVAKRDTAEAKAEREAKREAALAKARDKAEKQDEVQPKKQKAARSRSSS